MVPKAELHLHLEGTLEPELIFTLADRNGIRLPYTDPAELVARYEFTDLQSFLDLYYENMRVLRTAQDFADLTRAYLSRAAADGVRHAEVFLDPQAHTGRGLPLADVLDGVFDAFKSAEREHGISTGLIVAFLRDQSAASALRTLDDVLALGAPVLGVGLDSAEVGNPPAKFREVFDRARAEGLRCVAHAGEEGPAGYIWEALDVLRVERIDHGIRCLDDPSLVDRLRREQIPLTVCPLSNVRLRAVPSIAEHPLARMLRAGLLVTVNSDDPAYFGGYVGANYAAAAGALRLDPHEVRQLAANSIRASFLDQPRKDELLGELTTVDAAMHTG